MHINDEAEPIVISNFALTHFNAAVLFANEVKRIEDANKGSQFGNYFEEVSIYCSSCIISAAASVEALINELYLGTKELQSSVDDFETFFWGGEKTSGLERKPVLIKYKKALALLNKPSLGRNDEIYRHAESLIAFRDYLIHFKPLWDDAHRHETLESNLDGLFVTSPFLNDSDDFLAKRCMTTGCADWVISTTRDFIQEFGVRLEVYPEKFIAFK